MKVVLGLAVATTAMWTTMNPDTDRRDIGLVQQCEVTTDVEAVPVQAEPVQLSLRHTEAVGDSATAAFSEESGLAVVSVGQEEGDEPNTLRLVVNTSGATAGEWPITVRGTEAECTGTITVTAPETEGRETEGR